MKKCLFPFLFLLFAVTTQAQRDDNRKARRAALAQNVSPENLASLQAKKLTLALDLSDQQQNQLQEVLLQAATQKQNARANRNENRPDSRQERLALAEARMDDMIATKRAIKEILNAEQYEKFEKMKIKRQRNKMEQAEKPRRGK